MPGEIYAAVGNEYVLHSRGGQFSVLSEFDPALLGQLNASHSGRVTYTVFQTRFSCASGCDELGAFDDFQMPRTPIEVCSGSELLGMLTTASDAGAVLYAEERDGGWPELRRFNLRSIEECTRISNDTFFVAGLGAVFNISSNTPEVPDTSPLSREPSMEAWTKLGTDGTRVFAASVRGAVAMRDGAGVWSVQQVLQGEVTALAVDPLGNAWVAGSGLGLSRWDGSSWHGEGAGPPQLTSYDALALEGAHVYVGGLDATGTPRVFRRTR